MTLPTPPDHSGRIRKWLRKLLEILGAIAKASLPFVRLLVILLTACS